MTTEDVLSRLKAYLSSISDVTLYEGHPAVLVNEAVGEIERLAKERDEARDLVARLTLEAQIHAGEARAANSTIYEIYQALSGSTGEPGNWNGAKPAREYVAASEAKVVELREALARQTDNMAFIVNHASLYNWHDKFVRELEEDRRALERAK